MPRLPLKKLSLRLWLQIFGIWTLAAISMTAQVYLNNRQNNQEASLLITFLKQLPHWYLCALLTPIVIYFYEQYPLDNTDWKKNLRKQVGIALLVLLIFAHPRMLAISIITERWVHQLTPIQYLHAMLSQIAWDLAIYTFIMAIVFADKANSRRKERELFAASMEIRNQELQNQLKNAQLEALKLQLSPHFLFNTLNTVNALIRSSEYATAIKMNARLGDFLRTTLYADNQELVPLEKELQYLDLYLAIEALRFSDRLTFNKDIELECMNVAVPYFILQPIVENAIKHGIACHSSAKLISLQAHMSQQHLNIFIFNEGKLLSENTIPKECWNIGLNNVHNRLQKLYPNNFVFSIENHPSQNGVQVHIKIPHKVDQEYFAYENAGSKN